MPPVKCMDCMDAGYRMYDGTPSPCPSCDAGAAFEQRQRGGSRRDLSSVPRADLNPMHLPPGGDVMITEMKRQAAGLPVGVIGSDTLVRAQVESQPLVHELVRLLDDFTRDTPGTHERAVEAMGALPAWAIPDDIRDRETAAPEPDPEPGDVVSIDRPAKRTPAKPKPAASAAAPLEPPD